MNLEKLLTESRNPATLDIDQLSSFEIAERINTQDQQVAMAVKQVLPQIAIAIDWSVECLRLGGRLFYLGAGTSGRLGILDASECPPTFGTHPQTIQGIIAGGSTAMFHAVEGAEDSLTLAEADLRTRQLTSQDMVLGIAASGRTPYVIGGLSYATSLGCKTIALSSTPEAAISKIADLAIEVLTGPEVITGSTRMKAGTAQKMVLNMLSTATMIRLGKVYSNLMVDVQASNIKLQERAKRIVCMATGVEPALAEQTLLLAQGSAKLAIIMLLANVSIEEATALLAATDGVITQSLKNAK